ncbi:MAG: FecR family protein [Candidatus Pedobacter colombiensis]|uniref:FecR family protein n=1 Tax=Candidatus Pedobacter colombiensis TaxID=3121371 RepID=A0AAJ5W4C2_9SPHI|nr:FecR family protein [Pedobacter sp.]WEK17916.1 MAG: FecR family protein [Pedobacter sp.]
MEDNQKIINLFNKYISNKATIAEVEQLMNYIRSGSEDDYVTRLIEQSMFNQPELSQDIDREKRLAATHETLLKHINDQRPPKSKGFKIWTYVITAATLLLISLLGLYFLKSMRQPTKHRYVINAKDIEPGSNKAMLTLADGKRINLNDTMDGNIGSESGILIKKAGDGQLEYTTLEEQSVSMKSNTIETPNGGQYQVRLPDGTKVWLNAASKLTYPVSFMGRGLRGVTLSGEAYFQVAKDKEHPFIVKTATQQVTVLGTHFNINSYADEGRTVTTLEEGSVKVSSADRAMNLIPGQKMVTKSMGNMEVQQADLTSEMAWVNNKMTFKKSSVQEVLRQIARWYDLRIEYHGTFPDDTITGTIDRQANLATVLKIFESLQIHFALEATEKGKKLIITP